MPKHARTEESDSFESQDNNETLTFENENDEAQDNENVDFELDMNASEETDSWSSTSDDDAYPEDDTYYPDALEGLTPKVDEGPLYEDSSARQIEAARADSWESEGKKGKKHLTLAQKKSRRMRRVLIVIIALLIVLIGALGYFTYLLFQEAQNEATQQSLEQGAHDVDQLKETDATDSSTTVTKTTEAPLLTSLLGKTQEEAISAVGRGATVVSTTPVDEEGNPIKNNVKITLTDEPGDSRSGTPTVYLGLNEEGKIISAGYSAATSSLGYGSVSFSDAVKSESIIESTLAEAGLDIPAGTAVLPEDKSLYSTYATDGITLVNERYAFSGTAEQAGVTYEWSAVLRYDYTTANASGNLADTTRQIYVYVNDAGVTVGDQGPSENATPAAS